MRALCTPRTTASTARTDAITTCVRTGRATWAVSCLEVVVGSPDQKSKRPVNPAKKSVNQTKKPVNQAKKPSNRPVNKVYAENNVAFTLAGSPVSVDVTANDFVKHMDHLEVTKTWGSEHGSFEVLGRTVRYVPVPSYAGPDSCKYEICQGGQCNRRGRPSRGGDGDEGGRTLRNSPTWP